MTITGFAVVKLTDDGEIPQGIDNDSGGYPYDATVPTPTPEASAS